METCLDFHRVRARSNWLLMGPRFCKRGNRPQQRPLFANFDSLQWGHAFVSVETQRVRRVIAQHKEASMGPRFCKRGNNSPKGYAVLRLIASMGPRFCKRGNQRIAEEQARLLAIASMGPRFCKRGNTTGWRTVPGASVTLQWGHAFVSVETSRRLPAAMTCRSGFNGATLL